MSEVIIEHIAAGSAEISRVRSILKLLDKHFIPPISSMVNIEEYVLKIVQNADVFFLVRDNKDIGECVVYMNSKSQAYISSIGLIPEENGKGIGTLLLRSVIKEAIEQDISMVKLQVSKRNGIALRLYNRLSFVKVEEDDEFIQMICILK